jgi:glycosyltransferase involved in cell wall biosynthesis
VIGSSSGAIPEVVGPTGLVFPEGNVPALTNAVRLLIAQPDMTRKLGEQARMRALEQFTWARVAAERHALYTTVYQTTAR